MDNMADKGELDATDRTTIMLVIERTESDRLLFTAELSKMIARLQTLFAAEVKSELEELKKRNDKTCGSPLNSAKMLYRPHQENRRLSTTKIERC